MGDRVVSVIPYIVTVSHAEAMRAGRDSYLVATLNRIPMLSYMVSCGPREGVPANVGARRDSRTSGSRTSGFPHRRPDASAISPLKNAIMISTTKSSAFYGRHRGRPLLLQQAAMRKVPFLTCSDRLLILGNTWQDLENG